MQHHHTGAPSNTFMERNYILMPNLLTHIPSLKQHIEQVTFQPLIFPAGPSTCIYPFQLQ